MAGPAVALPDNAPHLLVVDDDRRIRDLLSRSCSAKATVTTADNAADARAKLEPVVDLLPRRDDAGRPVSSRCRVRVVRGADPDAHREGRNREPHHWARARCRRLRRNRSTELSLRIANILKRTIPTPPSAIESVRFGGFVLHLARGELRRGEDVVHLTDRERDMLRVLAAVPGETVPRQALGGEGGGANERAVDVQVNRLRRKIEQDPANPLFIQTVRGIGYRLVVSP